MDLFQIFVRTFLSCTDKNCLNKESLMGKGTSLDLLRHAQALNAMTRMTPAMKKYFGVGSGGVSVFL